MLNKKFVFSLVSSSILFLNSCGTIDNVNLPTEFVGDSQIESQSIFGSKKGKVPDNGDVNVRIDNLTLSRRTFNNAPAKIFIDGNEAFPAMEALIDSAQKTLFVETFIFHDDTTGRRIAQKLVSKKRQGVDVKVLIDALGLKVKSQDSRIFDYLQTSGVDVKKYNKTLLGIHGVNITHRKILIADGETSMTGGMNFGDEYEHTWHDSMTKVQGEVSQDIQREFLINWEKAGGKKPNFIPTLPQGKVYGNIPMRVTVTSAHEQNKRYQVRDSLFSAIDMAKTKITMAGAYFSDDTLVKKLIEASKRGVSVNIIMPKKGDSKIYNTLNMGTAKAFIKSNVNVFFYEPRFSHIKAAIIDNISILGSANPDARSFRENQELNIMIEDLEFQSDVENRLFDKDIKQSSIANLENIKVSLGKKIALTVYELLDYYI